MGEPRHPQVGIFVYEGNSFSDCKSAGTSPKFLTAAGATARTSSRWLSESPFSSASFNILMKVLQRLVIALIRSRAITSLDTSTIQFNSSPGKHICPRGMNRAVVKANYLKKLSHQAIDKCRERRYKNNSVASEPLLMTILARPVLACAHHLDPFSSPQSQASGLVIGRARAWPTLQHDSENPCQRSSNRPPTAVK